MSGGNITRRVGPGERLDDIMTTDWLGAVGQTVRQVASLRGSTGGSANFGPGGYTNVLIRNDTEDNAPMFGILGIDDGFVIAPADNLNEWKRTPILKGVAPTVDHVGKFVILTEPIAAGKIGSCCVYGIVTQINVTNDNHGFADITDGETGYLTSGESGLCRIIQKQGPPDEPPAGGEPDLRWALVAYGGGGDCECPDNWYQIFFPGGTAPSAGAFGLDIDVTVSSTTTTYTVSIAYDELATGTTSVQSKIQAVGPFASDPENYKVGVNGVRLPRNVIGVIFKVPTDVTVTLSRNATNTTGQVALCRIMDKPQVPDV